MLKRIDPLPLADGSSPLPATSACYISAADVELMLSFSQTTVFPPTELAAYEAQKLVEGWSARDVTRHLSTLVPRHIYFKIVDGLPVIRMVPTPLDAPAPTHVDATRHEYPQRYLLGALRAASDVKAWNLHTGLEQKAILEQALSDIQGTAITLTLTTSDVGAPPWRSWVQSIASDGVANWTYPRPHDGVLADVPKINMTSSDYADFLIDDATQPLVNGYRVKDPTTNNGVNVWWANGTYIPRELDNGGVPYDMTTAYAEWAAVGTAPEVNTLEQWIASIVPTFDWLNETISYIASEGANAVMWADGWYYLPLNYAWGVHPAFDDLRISPIGASSAVSSLTIKLPRTGVDYFSANADVAVRYDWDTAATAMTQLKADLVAAGHSDAEHLLSIQDAIDEAAVHSGSVITASMTNELRTPPAVILQDTVLFAEANAADQELLTETLVPATATVAALTFDAADKRAIASDPTRLFVTTENAFSDGGTYDYASESSTIRFDIAQTGVDPDFVYTVTAHYQSLINPWGPEEQVASVDQAKFYAATGATVSITETVSNADSTAALETYLGGTLATLPQGTIAPRSFRLDDAAFATAIGPDPSHQESADATLRTWLMTKGVNRADMEKFMVANLVQGQIYPQLEILS